MPPAARPDSAKKERRISITRVSRAAAADARFVDFFRMSVIHPLFAVLSNRGQGRKEPYFETRYISRYLNWELAWYIRAALKIHVIGRLLHLLFYKWGALNGAPYYSIAPFENDRAPFQYFAGDSNRDRILCASRNYTVVGQ
jgi:hypothetical protein